jgi:hypothetical protein
MDNQCWLSTPLQTGLPESALVAHYHSGIKIPCPNKDVDRGIVALNVLRDEMNYMMIIQT